MRRKGVTPRERRPRRWYRVTPPMRVCGVVGLVPARTHERSLCSGGHRRAHDRIGDEGMTRVGAHGRVLCHCVADAALSPKQLLSAQGKAERPSRATPASEICGSPDQSVASSPASAAFVKTRYSELIAVDDRPADGALGLAGGELRDAGRDLRGALLSCRGTSAIVDWRSQRPRRASSCWSS